jgi:hypothetical protein
MGNLIVTISREFGSGGRLVGEKLALSLGIPFYDKEIIHMAADKSGLSPDYIQRVEEQASSSFIFNMVTSAYASPTFSMQYETPTTEKAFMAQMTVIRELAAKGPCVIVGACADYILREEERCFKVFVRGEQDDKVKRAVEQYHLPENGIGARVTKIDKGRAKYYKYYTGETWGDIANYDLMVNTSRCGIDGAVEVIRSAIKAAGIADEAIR